MTRTRPTLRCLREDLALSPGPVDEPLDEIDHPLLAKANQQFCDPAIPHQRIAAIDDNVLFKVKIQRWRGAVWGDTPGADVWYWLVVAGQREEGSATDFHAALASTAKAARSRYNAEQAWSNLMDPTEAAKLLDECL
ncbi:MAG: hypothetical protein WBM00_06675 [Solirubrobacterales bacterium]